MKNVIIFHLNFFILSSFRNHCMMHGHVYVMIGCRVISLLRGSTIKSRLQKNFLDVAG